ncbi:anti-sigma factor [soil metagenome]
MAADAEMDGLAGEYVLGTLTPAERLETQALLTGDSAFAAAVTFWQRYFGALAETVAPREPSQFLKARILAAIGERGSAGEVVALKRRLSLWRAIGLGASAAAAVLAIVLYTQLSAPPPGQTYVAVLQSNGPEPAFVASIDLTAGTVSVRRLGSAAEPGKSYELWAVGGGRDKPQSLGVIDASLRIPSQKLGTFDPATVFAISLEPAGGSPTSQPTGPVLYTGKLVPTE